MTPGPSRLRLLPRPSSEPPAGTPPRRVGDDPWVQGSLALSYPAQAPAGRVLQPSLSVQALSDQAGTAARPLPDPERWATQLAQATVEVMLGQRPARQLLRWTDPTVLRDLRRRAGQGLGLGAETARTSRVAVRRVHITAGPERAVDAVALLQVGRRVRAMSLRLEVLRERYVCTELTLV